MRNGFFSVVAGWLITFVYAQPQIALEPLCATFDEAQNASLVLKWDEPTTGFDTYTRISATSVALTNPDRLLVIGGIEYESAQPVVINTTLVYDPIADTFLLPKDQILSSSTAASSKIAVDSPASRVEHAAFAYWSKSSMSTVSFFFGGQNKGFLNDLWRLCVTADNTQALYDQVVVAATDTVSLRAAPQPRIGHSFTMVFENTTFIGGLVYGGLAEDYSELGGGSTSGLHLALITKSSASSCVDRSPRVQWRILPVDTSSAGSRPVARAYHSASTVSRAYTGMTSSNQRIMCLYVFGGRNTQINQIMGDLWRLCSSESPGSTLKVEEQQYQWELLLPLQGGINPGPRYGAAISFITEGKFIIGGGSYAFPNDFLNDAWEFNSNASQWLPIHFEVDFLPPRRGHTLTLVGPYSSNGKNQVYLFGGRDRYAVITKRIQFMSYAAPYCEMGFKITLCASTGKLMCVPCPAGYYLQDGTRNCLMCPAGTYSTQGSFSCTLCPGGTYNSLTAQTSAAACLACPTGTYSSTIAASSSASCIPCAAGTFSPTEGGLSCIQCVNGTFSSPNAVSCSPCAAGKWSALGAATCSECMAGTYNPRIGSSSCLQCPLGFYSNSGDVLCRACPNNTVSAPSSLGSGAPFCVDCPPLQFTTTPGQVQCVPCPSGSTLTNGSCQACPLGTYASIESTNGACVPCPLHSYTNTIGSTSCTPCPAGRLTASTGAKAIDQCQQCAGTNDGKPQYFDGITCRTCHLGSFFFLGSQSCESCSPGTYTSTDSEASDTSGCQSCHSMTVSMAGSTACYTCPDQSYAMSQWRACIPCAWSTLTTCPVGRNGVVCSGNGLCILRGCKCSSGWFGGDCSFPIDATIHSANTAVLYWPEDQIRFIRVQTTPQSTVSPTFSVRIGRSGSVTTVVHAVVQYNSSMSNSSDVPSIIHGSNNVSVTFAPGESFKLLNFTTADFASVVGGGCRSLTLELVDAAGTAPSLSVISKDSDSLLTLYFDSFNGNPNPTGDSSFRSVATQYTLPLTKPPFINITIDRVVNTQIQLSPPSTTPITSLPVNIRLAIDATAPNMATVVTFIPAMIAKLEATYSPFKIRAGLVNNTSATYYTSRPDLFAATASAATAKTSPITWSSLAISINTMNTTQWSQEDGFYRRFLVVFANTLGAGDISAFREALQKNAVFAFIIVPTASVSTILVPNDVPAQVIGWSELSDLPQLLSDAMTTRDIGNFATNAISIVEDSSSILLSTTLVSSSNGNLPVVSVMVLPLSSAQTTAIVRLSIPGYFQLAIQLNEPGASCIPLSESRSFDDNFISGWLSPWNELTIPDFKRKWSFDSTTIVQLYDDTTLLRSKRTSILSLSTPSRAVGRTTITQMFQGSEVSPGFDLVIRGYVRHTLTSTSSSSCSLQLKLFPSEILSTPILTQQIVSTSREWTYLQFNSTVPWDVDQFQVVLDCNVTASSGVEWTNLGLFPDPTMACKCPRGFFYDVGTCVRCPAGSYCVAGIKRLCPLGFFSFGEADHCEKCRIGWICVNGLVRLCQPGTYASPNSTCLSCPPGYACRNGMTNICPVGTFAQGLASECQSCPPGTISTSQGASTCDFCPFGFTSNYQRDHCVQCTAGETTLVHGQHSCNSCQNTMFSLSQSEVCLTPS